MSSESLLTDNAIIRSSVRSQFTGGSHVTISSGSWNERTTVTSTSLHGNLMRSITNRDPMKVYEVISILGDGSMGSVAKVRKRQSAIGGSARPQHVIKNQNILTCFPNLFSCCIPNTEEKSNRSAFWSSKDSSDSSTINITDSGNTSSAFLNQDKRLIRKTSSMISYGKGKPVFYALKSIHLDRCTNVDFQLELKNEVAILKELDHPNIVRAIETFEYKGRLFIALELCNGGDLYTRDPYSEQEALKITRDLCSAVAYLHSRGIIHRDLKFENIMFTNTSKHADVKLIDFGLSKKFAANEFLADTVGTVYTMSPELISGAYNEKADVWSLGVICFMLLSSSMPFFGKTRVQVLKKIARAQYHFSSRRWNKISAEAMSFCETVLNLDPDARPSAEATLKLPWISNNAFRDEQISIATDAVRMDSIQASIEAFVGYSTLKKLGLMVIAYRSTSEEIGFLKDLFVRFDKMKNGEIDENEFALALSAYNYSPEEISTLFHGIDIDGTGNVHYIEFLAATIEALGPIDEERIAEAFDRLDSDDTGYITVANLRDFLGDEVPTEYLEKIIQEADLLHDHRISYEEFLEMWNVDTELQLEHGRKHVAGRRIISREPSFTSSVSSDLTSTHFESLRSLANSMRAGVNASTRSDFFDE
ncbi:hypothetical protein FisN_10Lh162 [Fistulifera solaris]|uniref:Calmodulin n=1 Tax=Fistulifera solaris TaxID=1519565 RepID=A0A1Z5JTN9_FISSO|nr:hypothetical protein FisN_10Lh162 [Fistulifera solaris]|eukprot:GAX17299.1 hypothetical protein FisN_10Lh162 [Fistulifera solaris]